MLLAQEDESVVKVSLIPNISSWSAFGKDAEPQPRNNWCIESCVLVVQCLKAQNQVLYECVCMNG